MSDGPDLGGKVALVTGSSRGIGRYIVQRLASAGATVIVSGRSATSPARGIRAGKQDEIPGTLAETVLARCHLPAAERTGLVAFSMHYLHATGLKVMSLYGKTQMPAAEIPAFAHPATSHDGL